MWCLLVHRYTSLMTQMKPSRWTPLLEQRISAPPLPTDLISRVQKDSLSLWKLLTKLYQCQKEISSLILSGISQTGSRRPGHLEMVGNYFHFMVVSDSFLSSSRIWRTFIGNKFNPFHSGLVTLTWVNAAAPLAFSLIPWCREWENDYTDWW